MSDNKPPTSIRPAAKPSSSLLQQLGGEPALDALIGAFYFNILRDDRVTDFFANTDVNAIRNHQRQFLAAALGGADQYRGRDLGEAHRLLVRRYGLDQGHLDAMTEILASTLSQFGYAAELCQHVVDRVTALGADVLGTSINQVKPTE